MHADYTGKGIDQLKECIEKIIKTPEDRRLIMTGESSGGFYDNVPFLSY